MTTDELLRNASEDELEIAALYCRSKDRFKGSIWIGGLLRYESPNWLATARAAKHHCLQVIRKAKGNG